MLNIFKKLIKKDTTAKKTVTDGKPKITIGSKTVWTKEMLEEMGYSGENIEKKGICRDIIRKTMEKSGWDSYETFCRMLEISEKKNVPFKTVYKANLWKEYKEEQADNLINLRDEAAFGIPVSKKIFKRYFYTGKQRKAIKVFKERIITIDAIEKYFNVKVPESIQIPRDEDITKRVTFQQMTLKKGDIFICVPGKYIVKETLMRKAPACVIGYPAYEKTVKEAGIPFVSCPQISTYVLDFAALWEKNFNVKSVGITGSVGKTSTTGMIGNVVESAFNMHKVVGNQNTTWQLVDFVFNMKPENQVYVQECSGSFPGQMEKSSRVVQPDIFVLTNIGNGHIGRYDGKQERLLYEKLGMDRHAAKKGIGIVNGDDELLNKIIYQHKVKRFAMHNPDADYFSENVDEKDGVINFDVREKDGTSTHVVLNVVGTHNVYNALAAFAVGVELGIERPLIVQALSKFETEGARQNLVQYAGQKLYIDCCSATEESMKTAVMAMENITVPEGSKKIAVLADVQMLGDQSEEIHRRIGKMITEENHADEIFFYGPEMKFAKEEAEKAGIKCRSTQDRLELEKWLAEETNEGDLIAFKAGHVMACQWIIDDLWGTNLYLHDKFTTNAPIVDFDGEQYKCVDEYGCALINADTKKKKVEIKDEVNGYPVRIIDNRVYRNSSVEEIVISDSVITIGERTFSGCKKLKNIVFPASLKYIGPSAFAGCLSLEVVDLSKGCETIDADAFKDCDNLKKVILPGNIKTIHSGAFESDLGAEILCEKDSYAQEWALDNSYTLAQK